MNDRETTGLLKRDVLYLRIDVDKNAALASKQGVRGYPTTLLVESSGKPTASIPGYTYKKEFKKYRSI